MLLDRGPPESGTLSSVRMLSTAMISLTLRDLTISCTDFEAGIKLADIPEKDLRSTPLRSLTFIECNIYLPLLSVALALPKALKKLSIGERLHAFDGCMPKQHPDILRTSHPQFLDELQRQADSLETLTHSCGNAELTQHYPPDPAGDDKLRCMTALKHLELDVGSPLSYYICEKLPDSLERITIFDASVSSSGLRVQERCKLVLNAAYNTFIKHVYRVCRTYNVSVACPTGAVPESSEHDYSSCPLAWPGKPFLLEPWRRVLHNHNETRCTI